MKTTDASPRGDFLATVVDRAHERAPLVAPRPASLFEPGATSIAAEAIDSVAAVTVSHDATPRVAASRDTAPAPRSSPPIADPAPAAARAVPPHARESQPQAQPVSIAAMPTAPMPAPPTVTQPAAVVAAVSPRIASQPAEPVTDAVRPTPSTPAMPIEPRHDAVAVPRAELSLPPRAAALLANRDVVASFAAAQPLSASPRDAVLSAPAAPVVTISIGRVDVRTAAATPPAVRSTQTPPSPMRLADYLDRKERAR